MPAFPVGGAHGDPATARQPGSPCCPAAPGGASGIPLPSARAAEPGYCGAQDSLSTAGCLVGTAIGAGTGPSKPLHTTTSPRRVPVRAANSRRANGSGHVVGGRRESDQQSRQAADTHRRQPAQLLDSKPGTRLRLALAGCHRLVGNARKCSMAPPRATT